MFRVFLTIVGSPGDIVHFKMAETKSQLEAVMLAGKIQSEYKIPKHVVRIFHPGDIDPVDGFVNGGFNHRRRSNQNI